MKVSERKPWLDNYKLGPYKLSKTVPIEEVPAYYFFDEAAHSYPFSTALIYQGRRMTYEELGIETDRLACALADLEVKKGDRVAILLPSCPQQLISSLGILKVGAVVVLMSPLLGAPDLQYVLSHTGTEVVFCMDEDVGTINSIREKTKIREIIITSKTDYTPQEEEAKEVPGTRNLRKLIEEHEPRRPEVKIEPKKDIAAIYVTGGTTGLPKMPMWTHYAFAAEMFTALPWLLAPLEAGIKNKASVLITVPLYHSYGHGLAHSALFWGLRLILLPDPHDIDGIIKLLKEYRPLMTLAIPFQLMELVQRKVGKLTTLVITAGAYLPKEVAISWDKETGMPLTQGYGLAETGEAMTNLTGFSKLTGYAPVVKHSAGLPVAEMEVKLVNPETNEEVPFGEVGEICLTGPTLMAGYWPTVGSGLDNGWVHTGDLAYMDKEGYFYIVDRLKDLITVAGKGFYSNDVDDVLFKHPAVGIAVAIGIPDPEKPGGENVKAFIKLREGFEGKVSADDIIAHCRAHLPAEIVPKFVEFRDELPLTATQKLFKRALREEEVAKMKARGEIE